MGTMIRGFLLGNDRDKVKKVKGEEGVRLFDDSTGFIKRYNPAKIYPVEESLRYLKGAARVIYGDESDESFRKLGAWDFTIVSETQLFKIAFKLFCPNAETAVKNIARAMNAFYIDLQCKVVILSPRSATITIGNDPYPETYFQGMFEEALRYFGCTPAVSVTTSTERARTFTLSWKDNNR